MELRGLRRRGGVQGAVLVLAGAKAAELRRASALAASLTDRCLLVAVDGGLKTCLSGRSQPDLFVGGVDSCKRSPAGLTSVILSPEDECTDLCGALSELRRRRVQVIAVAGLLGGRLDREWGNLLELGSWSRSFSGFLAPTDRGTVVITSHGCRMQTVRNGKVSLFALGASALVSLRGTRQELQRRRLKPGGHGMNNSTGTDLDLIVHSGAVALVFAPRKRPTRRKTKES